MIIETEMKLTIAATDVEKFKQAAVIAQYAKQAPEHKRLVSTYFDTSDLLLLKSGFILRIRERKGILEQTIKSANPSKEGLHQRSEWHHPLTTMQPDISQIPDEQIIASLQAGNKKLMPIFVTDFIRDSWELILENGSSIELALDQGLVICGKLKEPICEVELELLAGDVAAVFEITKLLQQEVNLFPEDQSKAERGYRLAATEAKVSS